MLASMTVPPRPLGLQYFDIIDLLECDLRPAFILDLEKKRNSSADSLPIVYSNAALRDNAALAAEIMHLSMQSEQQGRFSTWATQTNFEYTSPAMSSPTCAFVDILWSKVVLKDKWGIISANATATQQSSPAVPSPIPEPLPDARNSDRQKAFTMEIGSMTTGRELTETFRGNFSLSAKSPNPRGESMDRRRSSTIYEESAYAEFSRNFDWSPTKLGPMDTWSRKLREIYTVVMLDSRPAALYWSKDFVLVYNESFAKLLGSKHPSLLGKKCEDAWPDVKDALIGKFRQVQTLGRASVDDEWQLFLDRLNGRPEETYFSWSVVPIMNQGGEPEGVLNPVFETTRYRIWERRAAILNNLGEYMARAVDVESFWEKVQEGLEAASAEDLPFVILYRSNDDPMNESSSTVADGLLQSRCFKLQSTLGVPSGHPSAPTCLDLREDGDVFGPYFRAAMKSGDPVVLSVTDGTFPIHLLRDYQWRGFGDPCTAAVICPVRPTKGENVTGLVMIGINPRRPYDDDYEKFITSFCQKLATSLASSLLLAEETRRGRNAAAQAASDKERLSEQLALRTREVNESFRRFHALAEFVPVGMGFSSPEGVMTHANQTWHDITGFERFPIGPYEFLDCVADDYVDIVKDRWTRLTERGTSCDVEIGLKAPPGSGGASGIHKWVLSNSLVEKAPDGSIKGVITCLTDITAQKHAQEEAVERARVAEQLSADLARFKRIAEFATVGLFDVDLDGSIAEANDTFYEIMGMSKKGASEGKQSWTECVDDADLPICEKSLHDMFQYGKRSSNEIRVKNPWTYDDGSGNTVVAQRWILATSMPLRDKIRVIIGFSGCVTDISSQKAQQILALERAELLDQLLIRTKEAESSEARFARFADTAPVGISILDPEGRITYCNDTCYKIIGVPTAPLADIEEPWLKLANDADIPMIKGEWKRLMEEKKTSTYECRLRFRSRHDIDPEAEPVETWVMSTSYPELDEDGNILFIMTCLSDITQFKWAENIEKQRTQEALESKRQQENFIDMTSHEMRNPLSAVVQCADLIAASLAGLDIHDTAMQRMIDSSIDAAQTIISCAQHQRRIVDDILTLSKLDSKLLTITPVSCDPWKIIAEALKMFEAESAKSDIKLSLVVDKSMENLQVKWLLIDPSRLLQVLINLLTNALKFTQSGTTRSITVTMSALTDRPSAQDTGISYIPTRLLQDDMLHDNLETARPPLYLHFAVQDTGRGLTSDEKKVLFRRFSQAPPRTHVQYGGSGLGLFISRELTELQGGEIGVASEAWVGSTFAFYVKAYHTSAPVIEPLIQISAQKKSNGPTPRNVTILIVEDNLINQAVLSKQLRHLGCTVHVANHGGEALTLLKTTKYWKAMQKDGKDLTVVLLDIEMPIMDGLTCVRKIRDLQAQGDIVGHVPIIAVSGNARAEQIAAARTAGMDDVVIKPFRIPELMPKIEKLLATLGK